MSENKDIQQDFITYPRTFESYKWYKPLLVLILFIIIYLTFIFLETVVVGLLAGTQSLKLIDGGYDTLNVGIAGFATFLAGLFVDVFFVVLVGMILSFCFFIITV